MPEDDAGAPLRRLLKFVGGRFEAGGVHLDGVAELARYQRIVRALASDIWTEEHGSSLPTRLERYFELRLSEIGDGSFLATIDAPVEPIQTEDVQEVIELTRERVDVLFDRITQGLRPTFGMSHETRVALGKFGSSFMNDEGFQAQTGSGSRFYGTDQRAWVKLMLKAETRPVTGTLIGKVYALNVDAKSFLLELPNGEDVPGSYQNHARWEDIRSLLDLPDSRTLIRLACTYEASETGEPIRVKDVEVVDVFSSDANPYTDRFAELAALNPGWIESAGERIEISAIEMARDILALLPDDSPRPSLFPTPDGGVQIEWLSEAQHVELTISPEIALTAHAYDARTREAIDAHPLGAANAATFVAEVLDAE